MSRYIDADNLIKSVTDKTLIFEENTPIEEALAEQMAVVLEEIDNAPTDDVVEVVRCKDCKYLYCFSAIDRRFYCRHYPHGLEGINIVEDNPYCSYGERREE